MKKLFGIICAIAIMVPAALNAQKTNKVEKKVEKKTETTEKDGKKEIIIEKTEDGKDPVKMVIKIDGDNVTINGMPADEYKRLHGDKDEDWKELLNGKTKINMNGFGNWGNMGNQEKMAYLGVETETNDKGAVVESVCETSAAAKVGLKEGDIITAINGKKITEENNLSDVLRKLKPEETVDITYLRNGTEQKVKATLGECSSNFDFNFDFNEKEFSKNFKNFGEKFKGLEKLDFNFDMPNMFNGNEFKGFGNIKGNQPKYGMDIEDNSDGDGVKITEVDAESNAEKAGLKQNDIITDVDGSKIKDVDALRKLLAEAKAKDATTINLKVLRNGKTENISVKVPKIIKSAEL